ncbi:MAG TPA: type II secretion system F family protein [Ilumatobacteraceae bacterium]|nr:type II secretion system F family protein [Ilumatobacteraceae bacterium]
MNVIIPAIVVAVTALGAARLRPRASRQLVVPIDPSRGGVHPLSRFLARRAGRRPPSAKAVAEWCDDLARQLRSGSTLRDAMTTTLPSDPATRRSTNELRRRLDRGRAVVDACEPPSDAGAHLRLAIIVITTAARLGGSPAPAIDRTAATLRQRAVDADERSVQAAQARLSAHVLTAVPLAMLLLLLVTDADVRVAATSTLGGACIGVGLSLNALGSVWMRRIIGSPR